MLAKSKQFLLLIRRLACYSYIQSSLVKVLAVIKERKNLRKKYEIHFNHMHIMTTRINRRKKILDSYVKLTGETCVHGLSVMTNLVHMMPYGIFKLFSQL
jgi:hypothetical protein